ncbi:MAG: photosynthetic complex assembly protein PuhC [Gemmatimonas sp.]|jgi:putative photosynthetic complex assembly protein|uniref:photosynthetic complex assembly protein PuhC n=1 Tax=Gemmatimonas sp. TaxID=1962908 RepID=UPI00391F3231|nr:photosynthetic complex assembly protein PuhC [Gemmatimonadota bacterium]
MTQPPQPGIIFEPEPGERPGAPPLTVPKPALIMAGLLVLTVFILAASARFLGFGAFREVPTTILVERALRFEDAPNQGITVIDATTNTVAVVLAPGSNGFLRGALRALTRSRMAAGIGHAEPFRLVRYTDGRLVLHDDATRQQVTITSFGPTQIESFDNLLKTKPGPGPTVAPPFVPIQ